jgi:hypothetical protein
LTIDIVAWLQTHLVIIKIVICICRVSSSPAPRVDVPWTLHDGGGAFSHRVARSHSINIADMQRWHARCNDPAVTDAMVKGCRTDEQ